MEWCIVFEVKGEWLYVDGEIEVGQDFDQLCGGFQCMYVIVVVDVVLFEQVVVVGQYDVVVIVGEVFDFGVVEMIVVDCVEVGYVEQVGQVVEMCVGDKVGDMQWFWVQVEQGVDVEVFEFWIDGNVVVGL